MGVFVNSRGAVIFMANLSYLWVGEKSAGLIMRSGNMRNNALALILKI